MIFESAGSLAARRLGRFSRQLLADRVCEAAKAVSAGRFEPVSFQGNSLTLKTTSSAKLFLIRKDEPEIKQLINQRLKSRLIQHIVWRVEESEPV